MRSREEYEDQRARLALWCGATAAPCALLAYLIGKAINWDAQGSILTIPFVGWFWFGSLMTICQSATLLAFSRPRLSKSTQHKLIFVLCFNLLVHALGLCLFLFYRSTQSPKHRSESNLPTLSWSCRYV